MKKVIIILTFSILIVACKKENKVPTANAGIDQSINEGATVTHDGSASSDPDGDALTYLWTAPSEINLSLQTDAKPTFTAPEVSIETKYTFSLVVNDGQENSIADEVVITVANEDKFLTSIKAGQTDGVGIRYVDFVPDAKLAYGNNSYTAILNLDMNNDSIDDFELNYTSFAYGRWYQQYSQITPLGNSSVCVSKTITTPNFAYAESLEYGDTIGINNNWINSKAYLYRFYKNWQYIQNPDTVIVTESFYGDWYNQNNIYVGVKIIKDDKQLFGWIDMKDTTVRRYAVTKPY